MGEFFDRNPALMRKTINTKTGDYYTQEDIIERVQKMQAAEFRQKVLPEGLTPEVLAAMDERKYYELEKRGSSAQKYAIMNAFKNKRKEIEKSFNERKIAAGTDKLKKTEYKIAIDNFYDKVLKNPAWSTRGKKQKAAPKCPTGQHWDPIMNKCVPDKPPYVT